MKFSSKNKKSKMYKISNILGFSFCTIGILIIILKGFTGESIDSLGIIHENFFLLPIGFLFVFLGITTIFVGAIHLLKNGENKSKNLSKIGYLISVVSLLLTLLIYSNGNRLSIMTIIFFFGGLLLIIIPQAMNRQ